MLLSSRSSRQGSPPEADAKPPGASTRRRTDAVVNPHPIRGPPRETPMFVELKKSFLGRAAGERIDVSEDDARQLVQQGTAVAVTDDLDRPGRRPRPRRRPGPRRPDHRRGRQPVAQGLRRRPDAGPQARRPGHLRRRRRTAIRTAGPSATGASPSPAATGIISKSTTAAVSSSTPARPPWPRPAASPAATPCRPSSTSSS